MAQTDNVGSKSTWKGNELGAIEGPEARVISISHLNVSSTPNRDIDQAQLNQLKESIRFSGLLTRVIVNQVGGENKKRIVAGWRRVKALQQLGPDYGAVPCLVFYNLTDEQEEYIRKAENVYQQNLTAAERADWAATCRRIECGKDKARDTKARQKTRAKVQKHRSVTSSSNELDVTQPVDPPPILYGWMEGMEDKTPWSSATIRRKKAAIHEKAGVEVKTAKGKQYTAEESAKLHAGLFELHLEEEEMKKKKAAKKPAPKKKAASKKPDPKPRAELTEAEKAVERRHKEMVQEVALMVNKINSEYSVQVLGEAVIASGVARELHMFLENFWKKHH